MKILVSSMIRQDPEILNAFLGRLQSQLLDDNVELSFWFLDDNNDPESSRLLRQSFDDDNVQPCGSRPHDLEYEVTQETHHWNIATFDWLARQKQRILDKAAEERFDAVWIVDSDLMCDNTTLQSLIDVNESLVSAVFYTRWQEPSPPLPQVWLRHPYEISGRGMERHEFLQSLADRNLQQVWGLGANTLIKTDVLDRVRYFPRLSGLPEGGMWQGEDRSFCLRAERNHVIMLADAWPDVFHVYRPSDKKEIPVWEKTLDTSREEAGFGDLVSFSVEPLEDQRLKGRRQLIRGRLGQIKMLKELEENLLEMKRREARIVQAEFPFHLGPMKTLTHQGWVDLSQEYRGKKKRFRVKMLDIKPYHPHPTEAEWISQTESYRMHKEA